MSTLKAGDTKEFKVGDQALVVEPLPLGSLKKIIKIIAEVGSKFDKKTLTDDILTVVPGMVEGYIDQIIPLLFSKEKHTFMSKEWVDDHLTLPLMKEMFVAAIAVNGLGDFFLKTVKAPAPTPVEQSGKTTETSSEKSGSTTSSESLTDGAPKT